MFNPLYEKKEVLSKAKEAFRNNPVLPNIKLAKILDEASYKKVAHHLGQQDFTVVKNPLESWYSTAPLSAKQVTSLVEFAQTVIGKKISLVDAQVIKLEHRNFSMLPDTIVASKKTEYELILDCSVWDEKAGGDIVYVNDEETIQISACANTLILVEKTPGTRRFFQYVNHYGTDKKRLFLVATLK